MDAGCGSCCALRSSGLPGPSEVINELGLPADRYNHGVERVDVQWDTELAGPADRPAAHERNCLGSQGRQTSKKETKHAPKATPGARKTTQRRGRKPAEGPTAPPEENQAAEADAGCCWQAVASGEAAPPARRRWRKSDPRRVIPVARPPRSFVRHGRARPLSPFTPGAEVEED